MIDTLLTILNHGGAALLLLAIFGIEVASFVLRHERAPAREAPKPLGIPVELEDPLEYTWDELDDEFEIKLRNGDRWRSGNKNHPIWCRYPDGLSCDPVTPLWYRLERYFKQIQWRLAEARAAQGAHAAAYHSASPLALSNAAARAAQQPATNTCPRCSYPYPFTGKCPLCQETP